MVKIRLGTGWREDPSVRLALARGGPGAVEVAQRAADALAIEVEGVDVAAGRAEGALLPTLTSLADATARLVAGAATAEVHLPEGTVELLLRRQGSAALLTVVSLGRPSRLLARDVAVDLTDLAGAAGEAGRAFLGELAGAWPGLSRSAPVRALREALGRLAAARPADPPPRAPAPRRQGRARSRRAALRCEVALSDDEGLAAAYRGPGPDLGSLLAPGRVALLLPGGQELAAAEGVPFLLLRDLAALGARVADAVRGGEERLSTALALPGRGRSLSLELDLRRGMLAVAGRPPVAVPALALAEALLAAALDFCGVLAARNPWQAGNGYLLELQRPAAAALAHLREVAAGDLPSAPRPGVRRGTAPRPSRRPLGPGRLRRLAWRRTWEAEVGPPAGAGLFRDGGLLVAAGAAAVLGLDARTGAVCWRAPGAAWAALAGRALLLASGARLTRHDLASGAVRWVRPLPSPAAALGPALRLRGGPLLLPAGGALAALDPDGGAGAWRFEPPGAAALSPAAFGTLCAVAADTGLLYGVDLRGRVAWRLLLPGPPAGPPVAFGRLCAVACAAPSGGGAVLALDPATGRRAWEAPLDFAPSGSPLPFAGRLAVPGAVAGDPVVAAVEPSGAVAWTSAPPLGRGAPALAALGGLLVVQGGAGGCAGLDRDGASRWLARAPAHPAPGVPPHAARGVVVVAGDPLEALDAATGAPLGEARLPPPARLLVDGELGLWAVDGAGQVAAARLAGRLGLLGQGSTPA